MEPGRSPLAGDALRCDVPPLPPAWLAVGAVLVWLPGQLAVLGPALRAAAVPPVVATRSV